MVKQFLVLVGLSGSAFAQYGDFTNMDITGMYNNQVNQNNAQYQQMTNGIVQQNMHNPQVQNMYRQYQQQGGQASFEQFCYMYGATGGFTQQGINQYHQVQQGINAQQQQAWSQYQAAQAQRAQAQRQYANGYYQNQQEAGYNLNGHGTYYSPNGSQQLPYTWQPGNYNYNNQTYHVNPYGQYYQVDPNGWMTPIYQGR